MVEMTQSFSKWCFTYHKDLYVLLLLGHTELLTEELAKEYLEWCATPEGIKYLKGGSEYKEN